jgi:hypothetical protein
LHAPVWQWNLGKVTSPINNIARGSGNNGTNAADTD